jgi:hypothetical protein
MNKKKNWNCILNSFLFSQFSFASGQFDKQNPFEMRNNQKIQNPRESWFPKLLFLK